VVEVYLREEGGIEDSGKVLFWYDVLRKTAGPAASCFFSMGNATQKANRSEVYFQLLG
jgi:hypothetical protein